MLAQHTFSREAGGVGALLGCLVGAMTETQRAGHYGYFRKPHQTGAYPSSS